jgi:hypothetical protein
MNENAVGMVALILIFGGPAVVGIIAIVMHFYNRRKMYDAMTKMVELGKKPEEIKALFEIETSPKKKKNDYGMLTGGIIIIGIAAGLALIAAVMTEISILAPAAFLLCLSFALIIAYYVTHRKKNNGNKLEK